MALLSKPDKKTTIRLLKAATHIGALLPLIIMIWDYQQGQLGADIIRELTLRTGKTAIIILVLSLAVTPVRIVTGWSQVTPLRKLLGLYAFLYVALHLSIFVWLDYGLNWQLIQDALLEKWYALVGFAAFLILLPLAATSTKWAMRKLGKRWKQLHKWVYLAGILAVLHYLLLVKNAYTQPIIFAVILGLLLLARVDPVKQRLLHWQRSVRKKLAR